MFATALGLRVANTVPHRVLENCRKLGIDSGPTTEHPRRSASAATIGPLSHLEVESMTCLWLNNSRTSAWGTTPR